MSDRAGIPLLIPRPLGETLVRQRFDWDCGVACVAMALGITWEEARARLGPLTNSRGYFPHEVAAAVGGEIDRYDWGGSLDRCIAQVIIEPNGPPQHFVWIDGGLWCPAAHCDRWTKIFGFGQIIKVPTQQDP